MKLSSMGMAGFLWVTQESPYRESNNCMWSGGSGMEAQNVWEMLGLFLKSR